MAQDHRHLRTAVSVADCSRRPPGPPGAYQSTGADSSAPGVAQLVTTGQADQAARADPPVRQCDGAQAEVGPVADQVPAPRVAALPALLAAAAATLGGTVRIHLDTDIGGDIDDLQALAYLLASPGVEITGITTAAEQGGRRAGYVHQVLRLAGRTEIPVAAGIDVACGRFRCVPAYPSDEAYWGGPVPPVPGPAEDALALLQRSLDAGATLVGIGPWTNLAMLEETAPGSLSGAALVLLGTCAVPPQRGYPNWGPELDYNVQLDTAAARTVLGTSMPVVVPLGPCLETALRRTHVPRLRDAGPLGVLLARQAEQFDRDVGNADKWAVEAPALPPDTINPLHDPLACAIAVGWRDGVRVEPVHLRVEEVAGSLVACVSADGRPAQVVTAVDGLAFSETWVQCITCVRS